MVFYVLEVPAIDSLQENITGTEGQMADAFKVETLPVARRAASSLECGDGFLHIESS